MIRTVLLAVASSLSAATIFTGLMLIGEPRPYAQHQVVKYAVVGSIIGLVFFVLHLRQKDSE